MDALAPVTLTRRPDPDECGRVLVPIVMRQRGVVVWRILCGLIGLLFAGFGILIMTGPNGDYVFGPICIAIGLAFAVGPPLWLQTITRRRIVASVEHALAQHEVMTIAESGVDITAAHASSHLEWPALASAQRIPQGLLFKLGIRTVFLSAREFDSEADFERALELFKAGLGATFKG